MRGMKRFLIASAAVACFGATYAVAADDPFPYPGFDINLIGGGASFPSVAYRQIFDCQSHPLGYNNVDGPGPYPVSPACVSQPYGGAVWQYLWIYYAPTGSGNGKATLKSNNNQTLTAGPLSTTIPYTSSILKNYKYPQGSGYHFSGSDDVWTLKDVQDWNAGGNNSPQNKFGNMIQIPALAGSVAIVLNGKGQNGQPLTQNGTPVSGSSSAINLTRQALCGIFSGHVTKWSNSLLTASNGGTPMGSGQITVVHRFDGSGTNFLLTNALVSQCQFVYGPNSETDAAVVSYAFPWTDRGLACPGPVYPQGANQHNWPGQFPNNQCGAGNPNPVSPTSTGAVFTNPTTNGTQSLVDLVANTPGAIGYASPDFVQPALPTGLTAANLQNQWDISTNSSGVPTFVAPTLVATDAAMTSVTPSFDATTRGNPLAWSLQGVVPNPSLQGAYPIAGFTWLEMYQCYNSGTNVPVQLSGVLYSIYGAPYVETIINLNGFVKPPYVWLTEIYKLMGDESLQPRNTYDPTSAACFGKAGAT